jgi:signal transduction histidine kinase
LRPMDSSKFERIFQHIVEIGSGTFELTEEQIMSERDEPFCEILIGLLTLKEDLEFQQEVNLRKSEELLLANEELLLAKREAEAANRAKSNFLSSMSHELRTPLNAILGYSELLIEDAEDAGEEEKISDLDKIRGAGRHLLSLISDVLDMSKIEAGKMKVLIEEFDIAALVEDVLGIIAPLMESNRNKLVIELDPHIGTMRSDEVKLRQSLINLLSNSAKFTKDGQVRLRVQRLGEPGISWLQFSVADTGIGMTPKQSAKMFQTFTQADDAGTTEEFGGTGLGLAISKQFCNMLGGDITVESALDKGSTFTMTLPAIAPSEV